MNLDSNRAIMHIVNNAHLRFKWVFAWNKSCEVRDFLQISCWKFFTCPLEILKFFESNPAQTLFSLPSLSTLSSLSAFSLPCSASLLPESRAEQAIMPRPHARLQPCTLPRPGSAAMLHRHCCLPSSLHPWLGSDARQARAAPCRRWRSAPPAHATPRL